MEDAEGGNINREGVRVDEGTDQAREKREEEEVGSHASLLALFSRSEVFP